MATKKFALNTQPHEAEIGDVLLSFQPEVMGDEFLDSYGRLQETTKLLQVDLSDAENVDVSKLRGATIALRLFLATLMLPESAQTFIRWEVQVDGEVVEVYADPDEAQEAAERLENATVVDAGVRFPDRVLVELMDWVVELYGGGANRPPTSSNASAPASPPPGRRGRATLPSKASTSTAGR